MSFHYSHRTGRLPKGCHIQRCNLCRRRFLAACRFERFCLTCKMENELYHFYETVPHLIDEMEVPRK